ncbi:MAG: PAS domain S-box protein [Halobacteriota archaeon]
MSLSGEIDVDPPHLLVVSADFAFAEAVASAVPPEFHTTVVDSTVEAATALDTDDDIHCVLCTHDPPAVDGFSVLESVRSRWPSVPFLFVSKATDESVAVDAISAGVTDYLHKRWVRNRPAILADRIRSAIDAYRTRQRSDRVRHRAAAILDANPDFIFVFTEDAVYQEILAGADAITAYAAEDLIGRRVEAVWPADAAATLREAIRDTAESGACQRIEYRLPIGADHAYDTETAWYEGRTAPLEFDGDSTPHVVLSARDITDRKALERDRKRTQRAVDASGHAIYITDVDGRIEYVNPAFEEITGYRADEAIGEKPRILQSGETPPAYYERLWETLLAGDVFEEEICNRRKDGKLYHAHQTIAPVRNSDGTLTAFVAIQTDVTDRYRLEAALRESVTQLRVLDRVLRHNLRNELNVIQGYAETIREAVDGDPAANASIIVDTCDAVLDTVATERQITAVVSEPAARERHSIDLGALLDSIVADVRDRHPHATISVDRPSDVTVTAIEALEQAVEELLQNAIEHSDRETPSIEVGVTVADGTVELRVADDGPGIPEMDRRVVTGEAAIEPLYHGSGLGLWLVHLIVNRSGGDLWFESNDPRGSVVCIRLSSGSNGA